MRTALNLFLAASASSSASVFLLRQRIGGTGQIVLASAVTRATLPVKTLVWEVRKEESSESTYAVVVLKYEDTVNRNELARVLGSSEKLLRLASPTQSESLTGFRPGCIPPIGHSTTMRTVLDEAVVSDASDGCIVGGGGGPDHKLILSISSFLSTTTNITVASIRRIKPIPTPSTTVLPTYPIREGVILTTSALRALSTSSKSLLPVLTHLSSIGADINERGNLHGKSALHFASAGGSIFNVHALLAAGAEVDLAVTSSGRDAGFTPIMLAAEAGKVQVVETLLKAGADVRIISAYGDSAYSLARSSKAFTPLLLRQLWIGLDSKQPYDSGKQYEKDKPYEMEEQASSDTLGDVSVKCSVYEGLREVVGNADSNGLIQIECIIASKRQVSRALVFCNLVPTTTTPPRHPIDWFAWQTSSGITVAIQMIVGKTHREKVGIEQAAVICKGIKVGAVVRLVGRLQTSVEEANIDLVVSDVQVLKMSVQSQLSGPSSQKTWVKGNQEEPSVVKECSIEGSEERSLDCLTTQDFSEGGSVSNVGVVDDECSVQRMHEYFESVLGPRPNNVLEVRPANGSEVEETGSLVMVGLDCEWKPERHKDARHLVSTLQISDGKQSFVIDLQTLCVQSQLWNSPMTPLECHINNALLHVFRSSRVVVVGFSAGSDLNRLAASYPHLQCFSEYSRLIDAQLLYRPLFTKSKTPSLSSISGLAVGKSLNKTQQTSEWTKRPLTREQVEYAALDACVLVSICQRWLKNPQWNKKQLSLKELTLLTGATYRITVLGAVRDGPGLDNKVFRKVPSGSIRSILGVSLAYQFWSQKKRPPPPL